MNAGTSFTVTFNSGQTISETLNIAGGTASLEITPFELAQISATGPILIGQFGRVLITIIIMK